MASPRTDASPSSPPQRAQAPALHTVGVVAARHFKPRPQAPSVAVPRLAFVDHAQQQCIAEVSLLHALPRMAGNDYFAIEPLAAQAAIVAAWLQLRAGPGLAFSLAAVAHPCSASFHHPPNVSPLTHRVPRRRLPHHVARRPARAHLCGRRRPESLSRRARHRDGSIRRTGAGLLPDGQPLSPGLFTRQGNLSR